MLSKANDLLLSTGSPASAGRLPVSPSSPRVLFIVPLVGQANCRSWDGVCTRLQGTLDCLSRQSCPDWRVLIVCNEPPEVETDDTRTTMITCDLPLKSDRPGARSLDKEKKLQYGMIHARDINPNFIMFLDADDRISSRLVEFVADHADLDGFLITRGYLYRAGSRWMVPLKRFHLSCGSCYVFRYRAEEAPSSMAERREKFWMIKAHNKWAREHFVEHAHRYTEIPFPAAIYLRGHDDSIRTIFSSCQQPSVGFALAQIRNLSRRTVRFLMHPVLLRDVHQREFGKLR